jgi:hypothetical protein
VVYCRGAINRNRDVSTSHKEKEARRALTIVSLYFDPPASVLLKLPSLFLSIPIIKRVKRPGIGGKGEKACEAR